MSQHIATLKPIFLSEEEAMALLDLCLVSSLETDPVKDRAILKISDLIRRYLSSEEAHHIVVHQRAVAA